MVHTAAITRKSTRRKNDQYFTPSSAVKCLLDHVEIKGLTLEPCAGENSIANVLTTRGIETQTTDYANNQNDDATTQRYWDVWQRKGIQWVVTNPPFNSAAQILPKAYEASGFGIAFLLRLSYLEPCQDRGEWLAKYPPNKLLIMPRISFTCNGKVDSCTTAWFVWIKGKTTQQIIIVPRPKYDVKRLKTT